MLGSIHKLCHSYGKFSEVFLGMVLSTKPDMTWGAVIYIQIVAEWKDGKAWVLDKVIKFLS